MLIKPSGYINYSINPFYLYGFNETGLAKAFAFIISKDSDMLFKFLRYLGIKNKNTKENYKNIEITTERIRDEGRTDIEISLKGSFHVIVEAKIGNNKILDQRTQYLDSFEDLPQKVLCFITQINDYKKQINDGVIIKNIGWSDIDDLIDDNKLLNNQFVKDFQTYIRRGYKLRNQKEILVQDLSDETEMKKYKDYNVYRRDVIFGSPLYFSPYFTKNSDELEGISYLSKILGIISCKPNEVESFRDDLNEFADNDSDLVTKWIQGSKLDKEDREYTYFFLANPVQLKTPLLKDGTKKIGRGKNWIAAQIPRNRCVTFEEFVNHMESRITTA
jgi:hypothetical protein